MKKVKVFLTNTKDDYMAEGFYYIDTNELEVLKGSRVSLNITTTWTFDPKKIIKDRVGRLDGDRVNNNVIFKSPSTAANFVAGRNIDGKIAWKDKNGNSVKTIVSEVSNGTYKDA